VRGDVVVTEEPMEIRAAGPGQEPISVAVTMRTPTADFELAAGFLHSEGLVGPGDIEGIRYCDVPDDEQRYNIVTVRVRRPIVLPHDRQFAVNASCGLCGKATLDALGTRCPVVPSTTVVAGSAVKALPEHLQRGQRLFAETGGLHGAVLVDPTGRLVAVREDVGRHNAVDKVVGYALIEDLLPLRGHLLGVSGRVSFEIVEKAAMAGIGVVGAVSAPSSLAISAAQRFGVVLVGFIRGDRYNIYAHAEGVDASR
jgi:FdhD protein